MEKIKTEQQIYSDQSLLNTENLPREETRLITQFKRDLKLLRYPVLVKNTNISIRSLQQFFYEYQPNKNLSLKLQNLNQTREVDVFVVQIIPNQQNQAASLNQDLLCKQFIEIYNLINIGNKHIYIKDPYTLNNYIFSNGFQVGEIRYLQQQYLSNLTNNYQIQLINGLLNLHQIQDVLQFNNQCLIEIIEQLEMVQIVRSNSKYNGILKLQQQDHQIISKYFQGHFDNISIGKYKIDGMHVLFSDYDIKTMKQVLSQIDNIYEFQVYNLTATLDDINRNLYLIRANNIYITNYFTKFNRITYKSDGNLPIQFDINTILFLLQLQLEYKYLVQVEFLAFDITIFIDLLHTIQIPKDNDFTFKHKHPYNPILSKAKKIKKK